MPAGRVVGCHTYEAALPGPTLIPPPTTLTHMLQRQALVPRSSSWYTVHAEAHARMHVANLEAHGRFPSPSPPSYLLQAGSTHHFGFNVHSQVRAPSPAAAEDGRPRLVDGRARKQHRHFGLCAPCGETGLAAAVALQTRPCMLAVGMTGLGRGRGRSCAAVVEWSGLRWQVCVRGPGGGGEACSRSARERALTQSTLCMPLVLHLTFLLTVASRCARNVSTQLRTERACRAKGQRQGGSRAGRAADICAAAGRQRRYRGTTPYGLLCGASPLW